jgi:hypothetical protein
MQTGRSQGDRSLLIPRPSQVSPHPSVLGDQVRPSWFAHDHLVGIPVCGSKLSIQ